MRAGRIDNTDREEDSISAVGAAVNTRGFHPNFKNPDEMIFSQGFGPSFHPTAIADFTYCDTLLLRV
ncbi:MAG: hypothetical protein VYA34_05080 [Myxococcota bacterium]|nr:hypothetical protein [Myxococcota bacterium]